MAIAAVPTQPRNGLVKHCQDRDGWGDPAPPAHVFGNVYMVGTCGIVALLVTSDQGHILIDGATAEAADSIASNIRTLGFKPTDVKILLSSHEHVDHIGGLASLKQITGAQLLARAEARVSLETGTYDKNDPQVGILPPFPAVKVDRLVANGESVTVGSLRLTAIATPGHSPGGTSWTWQSCEGSTCHQFVFADSLNAVSADGYRFTDHPDYVAVLRASMAKLGQLEKCDIILSGHPSLTNLFERLAGQQPLVDPAGCANYAKAAQDRLATRLANEAAKVRP
ncbi:MAG: subclass B3 metallo-beta-lactamase [Kofleriaceae bacterium]|nr:subclass B3 metallo-beta-lactamase [Kofleriaceae bacterium]